MEGFGIAVDGKSSFKGGVEWKGQGRAGSGRYIPLHLRVKFSPKSHAHALPHRTLQREGLGYE